VTRFDARGFIWILLALAALASAYYALAYYLISAEGSVLPGFSRVYSLMRPIAWASAY
jgi:hypothetical protein